MHAYIQCYVLVLFMNTVCSDRWEPVVCMYWVYCVGVGLNVSMLCVHYTTKCYFYMYGKMNRQIGDSGEGETDRQTEKGGGERGREMRLSEKHIT